MATSEERDLYCREVINHYLFANVWNEPFSEYRINIHPQKLGKTSCIGSFRVLAKQVLLPTDNEAYFIWYMNYTDTNLGLDLTPSTWYDTATLTNEWNTLIHAYTLKGKVIPKHCVYLRYNKYKTIVYIAIKKDAFKLVDDISQRDSLYLTIYYDSDKTNDVSLLSFRALNNREARDYQFLVDELVATTENKSQLQYFVDGFEMGDDKQPIVETGKFYDVICDRNIIFSFDIDYGSLHEDPVFLSTKDAVWKQLVHIPRALNPDNEVITHNTCDFFIRNLDKEVPPGRYVHRVTEGRTITQVTHNDMAIPLFVMDAYRDYFGSQNVGLHVVVRRHDKDNKLIRNANYIDLLYTPYHSDEDIINILVGKGPSDITWWRADNLEACRYVEMMFDTPDWHPHTNHLADYIDALGYYQVVNLLCRRMVHFTITDSFPNSNRSFTVKLPAVFLDTEVIPVVYLNGKMVVQGYYESTMLDSTSCKIYLSDRLSVHAGDKVSILFFATTNNLIYSKTVETGDVSIDIAYENPTIYLVEETSTYIKGVSTVADTVYRKCEVGDNIYIVHPNSDGSYKVTFSNAFIGDEFIIVNPTAAYSRQYEVQDKLDSGENIVIPLTTVVTDSTEEVPIFTADNYSVYWNRDYLVENVDYVVHRVVDSEGNLAALELIIQTFDHIDYEGENLVTVFAATASTEDVSTGYVIEDKLYDKSPVNLYFDGLTTVHVDGKLVNKLTYYGTYIKLPSGTAPQGSIWEVKTSVPKLIGDILKDYTTVDEKERIRLMNEYFYTIQPQDPSLIVLERKHRIYSVFINKFIHDYLDGTTTIVEDPDIRRMMVAIEPYLFLRDLDIVFKDNDQRFVDYYPQYYNYDVDPSIKGIIDAFIKTFMPENIDPTREVVY